MEADIHTILILTVRHTTCKGILYTYLHADVVVRIFLGGAYLARITGAMIPVQGGTATSPYMLLRVTPSSADEPQVTSICTSSEQVAFTEKLLAEKND